MSSKQLFPLLCRTLNHGILPSRFLSTPKLSLLKSCSLPCSLLSGTSTLLSRARYSIPDQLFLVLTYDVLKDRPPHWLLSHRSQEGVVSELQKPPGWLSPCCVAPSVNTGIVQVCHEDQGLQTWGFFQVSEEGLIYFLCLIRRSTADTHQPQCCIRGIAASRGCIRRNMGPSNNLPYHPPQLTLVWPTHMGVSQGVAPCFGEVGRKWRVSSGGLPR